MNKKMIKIIIGIVFVALFLLLIVLFLINFISEEKKNYEHYADYSMASIIMTAHMVKDFESQYLQIRFQQRYDEGLPITKSELIENFSQYKAIPILNYLQDCPDDETLFLAFSKVMEFINIYNFTTTENSEDIFVRNDNGKYYEYHDGIYTYTVKKKVIKNTAFQKLYYEYINSSDVKTHLVNLLLTQEKIAKVYSRGALMDQLNNHYSNFYSVYKYEIISIISQDLEDFTAYLFQFVSKPKDIIIDGEFPESQDNGYKINKEIESEEITMTYSFSKVQKLYNESVRYYKWLYKLDINNVWNQLDELEYPKLYI